LNGAWPGRFLPALRRSWRLRGGIGASSGCEPGGVGAFDSAAGEIAAFDAAARGFGAAFEPPADAVDFEVAAFGAAFEAAGLRFAGALGSVSLIDSFRRPRD
jgi:hypothetical protein